MIAFFCGALFAVGLGISGMTQPGKVTGFLDVTGAWDPSLLFVMMGAILVYAVGSRLTAKKPEPANRKIDRALLTGAAIFGVGWGLAGFCPGPALTSLVTLRREPLLFVASMLAGMLVFARTRRARAS